MTKSKLAKVGRGTLEKESLLEVDSEKVEMTLNTDSAVTSGLLIQRLTELYEDPIKAVVRKLFHSQLFLANLCVPGLLRQLMRELW